MAEPDYGVIIMATTLNLNTSLLCSTISIIVGRFQLIRYQNVQSDKYCLLTSKKMTELSDNVTEMADILKLNENLLCIIITLILGSFEN